MKTLILDNPTGSEQMIADTQQWVENGESVEIESDELADSLLLNPIWKQAKTKKSEGA